MGGVVGRRWAISRAINSSGALHTGPVPTRHSATTYTRETRQTERGAQAGGDRGTREEAERRPGRSEEERGDLLGDRDGGLLWYLGLLDRRDAGDEVHLVRLPDLGALEELPAGPKHEEDGDVDI